MAQHRRAVTVDAARLDVRLHRRRAAIRLTGRQGRRRIVVLGAAAVFVPLQFVVAALLVANGTRMVWMSACRTETTTVSPVRQSQAEKWEAEEFPAGELEAPLTIPARADLRAEKAGCRLC